MGPSGISVGNEDVDRERRTARAPPLRNLLQTKCYHCWPMTDCSNLKLRASSKLPAGRACVFAPSAAFVPLSILGVVELLAYSPWADLGWPRIWGVHAAVTCLIVLGVVLLGAAAARLGQLAGFRDASTSGLTLALCLILIATAHLVEPAMNRAHWLLPNAPPALRVAAGAALLIAMSWPAARVAARRGLDLSLLAAPLVALLAITIILGATVKRAGRVL